MKLQKLYVSNYKRDVVLLFYGFLLSIIILIFATLGCLFALMLGLPIFISICFIFGAGLFTKQVINSVTALRLLYHTIKEIKIFDDGIELSLVFGKKSFGPNSFFDIKILSEISTLFQRVLPSEAVLFEIRSHDQNYYGSLSRVEMKELEAYFKEERKEKKHPGAY
jgi:hypothetical protein